MTPALLILLLAAFVLRFAIAVVFFPHSGFTTDLASYVSWAETLRVNGPGGFYAHVGFADYPPGYLYLLWPIGYLANLRISGFPLDIRAEDLIKLWPIIADLAIGYVIYRLVRSWLSPRPRAAVLGLVAAALYLFNPVTWYDSSLWGQSDSVGALVLLLCAAALIRGNAEGAAGLAVVAAMVKPQFGFVAIPLVAAVLIRRHLVDREGPLHRAWAPGALGRWLVAHQGPIRLVTAFAVAWVVFFAMALPFGMGPYEYLAFIAKAAGGYQYISVNAFNPWILIGAGDQRPLAEVLTTGTYWVSDLKTLFGPITPLMVGTLFLIVGFVLTFVAAFLRPSRSGILIAAVVFAAAFFVLPTRVHERYVFPVFAFLPILAVASRRWRWVLLAFAVGCFINLHAILTNANPKYGTDNVANLALGDVFRTFPFVLLSVILQTAAFAYAAWQLRPAADDPALERALDEPEGAANHELEDERTFPEVEPYPWAVPAAVGAGSVAAMSGAEPPQYQPAPWSGQAGVAAWLDAKLGTLRPVRRDRSAELVGERTGRWDRLDLLVVTLVAVTSIVLRGWHLEQPFDMYFDEVYHARTATEFLQDWRYGIVHGIYEYTHPHMAKYAMALGIEAFGDNKVIGTSKLPQGVTAAVVEPRWSPATALSERDGDRLYVLDGASIGIYDLADRSQEATLTLPEPGTALAIDTDNHTLFASTAAGQILELQTSDLDARRASAGLQALPGPAMEQLVSLSGIGGSVSRLAVVDQQLVALTDQGWLASVDTTSAEQTGSRRLTSAVDIQRVPAADQVLLDPSKVVNPSAEANVLATDLAEPVASIRPLLTATGTRVTVAAYPSDTERKELQKHIDDGTLPGVSIASGPIVAVSDATRVAFLDAIGLREVESTAVAGAAGMALVERGLDAQTLYVAAEGTSAGQLAPIAMRTTGPDLGQLLQMPGKVSDVVWNDTANLVHLIGATAGGTPTIYVVEPHANSVFADAPLPFNPQVVVADTQPDRPQSDRVEFLALASDGQVATVDVGNNAFAWRLPGVIMGSVLAVCIYLLGRLLFRRRTVALFAAALVLAGGMFFANARIAMNDTYVVGFGMAAVTLFAPLYLGIWRRRWQVAAGLAAIGLLLGLALASKWVGAYLMGGLALLVLLRSALGRMIALAGMIALTAVLGALAVRAPDVPNPHVNVFFLILMLVLTVCLAVAMVRRPVRMSQDELRFVVVAPAVLGLLLVGAGVLAPTVFPKTGTFTATSAKIAGAAALLAGAGAFVLAWLVSRFGRGPLAGARVVPRGEPVPSPAPNGWLRPGHAGGIPWLYALLCLGVVPIVVYVASYIPWFNLGNNLVEGIPAGNHGSTLWNLTLQMYDYHNNLRAGHAASSPWWAWLFDLKPVWFYQRGFASGTTGVIYDAENLVTLWLGVPAMIFAVWAAWTRRNLSLTLVVLLFAAMWLPWARIDRATFQYHVFTSLPFLALALAYFLAELWHGPSPGVWLFARLAAAAAILGPPILWLGRQPLCLLSNSAGAHVAEGGQDGIACGVITRSTDISEAAVASVIVLIVGLGLLAWQLWLLYRAGGAGARPFRVGGITIPAEAAPFATLLAIVGAVLVCVRIFSPLPFYKLTVGADQIALLGLAALAAPAWLVLRSRDSRRFTLGILTAAVLWFVVWYPNLSGLPMPNSIANIYQGLLPTWNYDFWFAVNKDAPATGPIGALALAILAIAVVLVGIALVATHLLRPEKIVVAPEARPGAEALP